MGGGKGNGRGMEGECQSARGVPSGCQVCHVYVECKHTWPKQCQGLWEVQCHLFCSVLFCSVLFCSVLSFLSLLPLTSNICPNPLTHFFPSFIFSHYFFPYLIFQLCNFFDFFFNCMIFCLSMSFIHILSLSLLFFFSLSLFIYLSFHSYLIILFPSFLILKSFYLVRF